MTEERAEESRKLARNVYSKTSETKLGTDMKKPVGGQMTHSETVGGQEAHRLTGRLISARMLKRSAVGDDGQELAVEKTPRVPEATAGSRVSPEARGSQPGRVWGS